MARFVAIFSLTFRASIRGTPLDSKVPSVKMQAISNIGNSLTNKRVHFNFAIYPLFLFL